ncbi:unnamed protein product [Prorocentrum cordatum]|uniref:Calcineurin-like phosphoesterase domain-containing protein n=1 Tax=Prorocentrum cordatum TaxID=2364126 RepID=A0ABN9WDT9_9DINO|nr:unnamed protein product [Polarella glacialis]
MSTIVQESSARAAEPLFRFGLIADVQYADREDGHNFSRTVERRYRQSRKIWEAACRWWTEEGVDFVAQLGDFIDGVNREAPRAEAERALAALLRPLEGGPPAVHLLGNHELYNFSREELEAGISLPGVSTPFSVVAPRALQSRSRSPHHRRAFFDLSPCPGWRVLVLDPYDISVVSRGGGRPGVEVGPEGLDAAAVAMCQARNPNDILAGDFARGLPEGPPSRWLPFNGALGAEQLRWLRESLRQSHEDGEQVVVLSHVVLHPAATSDSNCVALLWNYEEALSLLREYPPVAVLCGHAHRGAHTVDEASGTHHLTLASPLEVAEGGDASAIAEAMPDGSLRIRGRGSVRSTVLRLDGCALAAAA